MRKVIWSFVAAGAAATVSTLVAPTVGARPSDDAPPSVVEDFAYPGAGAILTQRGITLLKGDGHIMLVTCGQPGLVEVHSNGAVGDHDPDPGHYCFAVHGPVGDLTLNIPNAYQVKGDNHDVQATITVKDKTSTVPVDKNGWTGIGISTGPDPATVLEIKATTA